MAECWARYLFKRELKDVVKEKKKFIDIADDIGITQGYLSQIINGRRCTKLIAYAVCKAISPELEIEQLFNVE